LNLTAHSIPQSPSQFIAHNVEVAGEIAGTWHIEPDHNPRAGEPAKVWVALTRKGGEALPFEQANCQMMISEKTQGITLKPELKSITAEQFQSIPGADVVFPNPGLYNITLSCTPKTEGDFVAFTMDDVVTVAAGTAPASPLPSPALPSPASPASPLASPSASPESPQTGGYGLAIWSIGIVTMLLLMARVLLNRPKS
jgi:hypothetical protein